MIVSGMITGSLLALSLTLLPNFDRFPWGGFAGIAALGPVGWWINRAENRWSAKRLTAFEEKWKSHLARSEQGG